VRVMIRSLHADLHPPHSSRPPDASSRVCVSSQVEGKLRLEAGSRGKAYRRVGGWSVESKLDETSKERVSRASPETWRCL